MITTIYVFIEKYEKYQEFLLKKLIWSCSGVDIFRLYEFASCSEQDIGEEVILSFTDNIKRNIVNSNDKYIKLVKLTVLSTSFRKSFCAGALHRVNLQTFLMIFNTKLFVVTVIQKKNETFILVIVFVFLIKCFPFPL